MVKAAAAWWAKSQRDKGIVVHHHVVDPSEIHRSHVQHHSVSQSAHNHKGRRLAAVVRPLDTSRPQRRAGAGRPGRRGRPAANRAPSKMSSPKSLTALFSELTRTAERRAGEDRRGRRRGIMGNSQEVPEELETLLNISSDATRTGDGPIRIVCEIG